MRRALFLILMTLAGLAGCGEGPVFPVDEDLYDWVTAQGAVDPASDAPPTIADQRVVFALQPGQQVSALATGEDWRIGQTYLFGFDVKVDPQTLGGAAIDLSRLYRTGGAAPVEIASVQLDARNGVTVMGRSCIPAQELGTWHRVEMRIKLSNGDTGYLEVFCDRQPVWAMTGMRTTFPPGCRLKEGCDAGVAKPARFRWNAGLLSDRPVSRPVNAEMRRLHYRVLFYVPNRQRGL